MSEFPEWVERELGIDKPLNRQFLYQEIKAGNHPDPRGSKPPILWRTFPPFDRRSHE